MRVLRCKTYVYIQKERRLQSDKLALRAEVSILVGFEGDSIYRVWVPRRRSGIVRTSTVTFNKESYNILPKKSVESSLIEPDKATTLPKANFELRSNLNFRGVEQELSISDMLDDKQAREHSLDLVFYDLDLELDAVELDNVVVRRRGRLLGSKNKPKPQVDAVRHSSQHRAPLEHYHREGYEGYVIQLETIEPSAIAFIANVKADPLKLKTYASILKSIKSI